MLRWIALSMLLLSLASCANMHLGSEAGDAFELETFTTWAWLPRTERVSTSARFDEDSPLGGAVKSAIKDKLSELGLERTSPAEADLLVTWHVDVTRVVKTYYEVRDAYGRADASSGGKTFGEGGGSVGNATVQRSHKEGFLSIDFHDRVTGEVVWHGWARNRIESETSLAESMTILRERTHDILELLPAS